MNRFFPALAAALVLALPAFAQPTPAAKPRIEKAADLPRFTYKLEAKAEDVVRSRERFAPFGAIQDLETYRGLLGISACVVANHSSLIRAL